MNSKSFFIQCRNTVAVAFSLAFAGLSGQSYGVVNPVANSDFSSVPVVSTPSASPLVMLAMSVDNQLFVKAYTDYSDLDDDGTLETTYSDSFAYYGYFNSDFCYSYSSGVYTPNGAVDAGTHQCTGAGGNWSGNFLNWASMTRMDVVRKVLYGGLRSTDTTSETILQRALIPNDSHAFVKVFASPDMSKYTPYSNAAISICNVTDVSGTVRSKSVDTSTNPPLMKVADGQWPQWSSKEVVQCTYTGGGDAPTSSTDRLSDFTVRVKSCVAGQDENASYCKQYVDGSNNTTVKPVGLLQRHGDSGTLRFGLLTGSYRKNDNGGVLRKTIQPIAGNATAANNELNLDNGIFTGNAGIINSLNRIRIAGWEFGSNNYREDCNTFGISISDFKNNSSGRECRDWGNPLSEIYTEALRYFAGAGAASSTYNTDDSSLISGLTTASWDDPMSADESCANCAIILLSTGINSFDADDLGPASGLPGIGSVDDWTEKVGSVEGINGNSFIVGNSGSSTNGSCTTKTVAGLDDVRGLCPEIPQLEGSYQVAGLAYYAKNSDLRTGAGYTGTQNVDTYTVALAETLPSFEVETRSGNTVSFIPTCQANTNGGAGLGSSGWTDCSLVDVTVVQQTSTYGQFLIAWEDSYWGNDYDMDGIASIEYCTATGSASTVQSSCPKYSSNGTAPDWGAASTGEIQMRASIPQANAGNALRFGFTMNGSVGLDGVYTNLLRPGGQTILRLNGGTDGTILWDSIRKFSASPTTGALLENPLYYAAKFGNYNDQDNDDAPSSTAEWDVEDINGNPVADGIPDSFFPVRNPANLEASLGRVFSTIANRVASGTAAAVVANNTSGEGAVYQALYNPIVEDELGNQVEWVGSLQGIFIDTKGRLREDLNQDDVLGDCSADPAVRIFFDDTNNSTKIRRSDTSCDLTNGSTHDLEDLKTIWNARDELAVIADPTAQRAYGTLINSSATNGGRHILTSMDGSTISDFDAGAIGTAQVPFFNVATEAEADNIVNFIRGEEGITGFRARDVDYDGDNATEIWRLGDIVNATPVVVGQPGAGYETLYGDSSYAEFKAQYVNRRQVVYVGANDGMLHAFNGGFFDKATSGFKLTNSGETSHPLGAELWAYVPFNVLPHLKWLTQPGYEHVYYVDGEPRVYDVNIFTPDTVHKNGWGTILVVGMRFGGAPVAIDVDGDGLGTLDAKQNSTDSDDQTLRSAYVIFDITDPESAPVLLGEYTAQNMGFTTGIPALVKARSPVSGSGFAASSADSWNLLVGSGPTSLTSVTTTDTAKLFGLRLESLVGTTPPSISGFSPLSGELDLAIANSFVGSPTSVDWDNDFVDDAVYFGIVGGTAAVATGKLMRQRLDNGAVGNLFSGTSQPFISAPETLLDRKGQQWVMAGTGRLYVAADQLTDEQQAFYGIKDPLKVPAVKDGATAPGDIEVVLSELRDTTNIKVFEKGDILENGSAISGVPDFDALVGLIDESFDGWYNEFDVPSGEPSQRNVSEAARVSNLVIYTSFQPDGSGSCAVGSSILNVRHFNTGTAAPFAPVSVGTELFNSDPDNRLVLQGVALGTGLFSAPVIHRGEGVTVITQGSTGEIGGNSITLEALKSGRQSWRQIFNF